MKLKFKNAFLFSISAIAMTSLIPLISSSCSNLNSKYDFSILTNSSVNDNFKTIWKNKTYLTSEDLSSYKKISINAFDNISRELDYVDISNLEIDESTSNAIKWQNVKEIRVNNSEDKKIVNDILFFKSLKNWTANTISNRNKNIDLLKFPSSYEVTNDKKLRYSISNDFYNPSLFKNVKLISFNDTNEETPIYSFGSNSFKDCDKLETNLTLNFNSFTNFNLYSFCNINSEVININLTSDTELLFFIQSYVFSSNKNLKSFSVNDVGNQKNTKIILDDYVFKNNQVLNDIKFNVKEIQVTSIFDINNELPLFIDCKNLSNITIIADVARFDSNNIFMNNYNSLTLSLLINNGEIYAEQQTFSKINVPVEKLTIKTYGEEEDLYSLGFSAEQCQKIVKVKP